VNRCTLIAFVLAMGGNLATAGTTMAAFQIVDMSATSGQPGAVVTMRVDASHVIGGSQDSQVFLIPQNAYEASPEPDRCDEIPGATLVGDLRWQAASVEFQGNTYPGFVGTGSFMVPDVETGIYVVSGILDDPYTGCHLYALFGVGMDLPDTATAIPGPSGSILTFVGFALLGSSVLLARDTRRHRTPAG
jgi:hypothetical protein